MPVPQRGNFIVGGSDILLRTGKMPVPQRGNFIVGGSDILLRTGKMPVPHRVNFIVGWASCPAMKSLLTMVQYLSFYSLNYTISPSNSPNSI
ncbi:hypothetical protein [Microcoleus sp. B4-C1]|uniref:hypothetical protein n=1 Tax=Microcoleus sp. B4-C1 TaxID=2818660 RepID=UPI002FD4F946